MAGLREIPEVFSWLRFGKTAPTEPEASGPCPLCGRLPNQGIYFYDEHCEPCWKQAALDHPAWGVTCKRCGLREPRFNTVDGAKLGRCSSCIKHCLECDGNTAGFGARCRCVELGKKGFTCLKCAQAVEECSRSQTNPEWCIRCALVFCKTCQSEGREHIADDRHLMLCETHLLAQHPYLGHTCTSCHQVALKVFSGLCGSCISQKSHQMCKRCGEVTRIKHNSICWDCWND